MNRTNSYDNFSKSFYNFSNSISFDELCNFMEFVYPEKNIIYKIENCEEIHWCKSENKNETKLTDTLENYLNISFDEEELNISCNNSTDVTLIKEDNEKNWLTKL